MLRVVLDTNVLVAALRSRRGASAAVLARVGTGTFEHCLSVALVLEYETACKRASSGITLADRDIEDILDYVVRTGHRQEIHFHWRPALPDPGDDHILELAGAAGGAAIITHNGRDFVGAERFGVTALGPGKLLQQIREGIL